MNLSKFFPKIRISLVGLVFSAVTFGWVSTSPQLTELLFQLDLGERLAGTTEQSHYPEAAKKLRRVGQLFDANLEAILSCSPSLVLWDGSSFNPLVESRLISLGIPTVKISLDSVEDLLRSSSFLVQKYKAGKKSDDLIRAEIEWDGLKKKKRNFSFLALAWGDPPIVFGKNTFLFSLFEGLGGTGILPKLWNRNYLKVSEEWMMAQNPDQVIYLKHDEASASFMTKQCEKWWPRREVKCVGISAEKFARASLTPLLFLSDLQSVLGPTQ
jgi:iron complex transport system substrate-binding protein